MQSPMGCDSRAICPSAGGYGPAAPGQQLQASSSRPAAPGQRLQASGSKAQRLKASGSKASGSNDRSTAKDCWYDDSA